LKMSLLRY